MNLRSIFLLGALSVLSLSILSLPSYAQTSLTQGSIESFYEQSAQVQMLGAGVAVEFLQKHTHEDARITMHITTNMAGLSPQKQKVIYNKNELIKATRDGYDTGDIQEIDSNVISVTISPDGRSAKVKSMSHSVLEITTPYPQGEISVTTHNKMLCNDVVILSPDNIIQAKEGNCSADIRVTQNF